MNAKERYDLVERYLDGGMPREGAREFEELAQRDSELAGELRAERVIRSAVSQDSAAIPVISTQPSQAIMSTLTATSLESAVGVSAGVVGTVLGTPIGLTMLTVAAVLGLVVGILFFGSNDENVIPSVNIQRSEGGAIESPTNPQAIVDTLRASRSSQAGEGDYKNTNQVSVDPKSTRAQENQAEERNETKPDQIKSSTRNAIDDYLREQEDRSDIPKIENDSVKLKIDVEQ